MADPFPDQGGAATMDPPAPLRWLTSKVLSHLMSPKALARRREKAESARRKAGVRHRVEYFHQIEDSYSQLALQLLQPLLDRYDVDLVPSYRLLDASGVEVLGVWGQDRLWLVALEVQRLLAEDQTTTP